MKTRQSITASLAAVTLLLAVCTTAALAQGPTKPPSSIENPGDIGQSVQTQLQVLTSFSELTATPQVTGPPFPGYLYQTPASIACVYSLQPGVPGCNPNVASSNPSGGSRAIAIVDAFNDPQAYSDLQHFSTRFGLTPIIPSTFQVVYAPHGGATPGSCRGRETRKS